MYEGSSKKQSSEKKSPTYLTRLKIGFWKIVKINMCIMGDYFFVRRKPLSSEHFLIFLSSEIKEVAGGQIKRCCIVILNSIPVF